MLKTKLWMLQIRQLTRLKKAYLLPLLMHKRLLKRAAEKARSGMSKETADAAETVKEYEKDEAQTNE